MPKAHSVLKIIDGITSFVKMLLIVLSVRIAIFVFALYQTFTSTDAKTMSFEQWQTYIAELWPDTMNYVVQMYLIVLAYLIITIPLAIKTHRESKSFCCQCTCNRESRSLTTVASSGKSTP